jgi:hypothetical protein
VSTTIPTSGTARRRAKAIRNRHHVEDLAFYRDGTIPASSTAVCICSCGARSFSRNADGDMGDFDDAHAYCDEYEENEA